ncbi:MAG: S-adenosyl-l-methionine hydroxide adenosyltransferase family protein [Halodesulfurarchaeum sp.]
MITLSSDFGSPYPAAMKGVILSTASTRLVDVAHDLPRQNVRAAAFWLHQVLPYFPPAVHLVVVDPGVGTERGVLAVVAGEHVLVGPDNGVLIPPARAIADTMTVYAVDGGEPASETFHGRDVFAPLAADIHEAGVELLETDDRCTPTTDYETIAFPEPERDGPTIRGEVLVVDGFGNVVTNVPGSVLDGRYGGTVRIDGETAPVRRTYATVSPGKRLVTVGSHGNVELAVNQGRGDDGFGLAVGDTVELTLRTD